MSIVLDSLLDALIDTLRALPFLFVAFLLMELLEKHSEVLTGKLFKGKQYVEPVIGAGLGLVPQCGFSAALTNLYVGGVVSIGTLIAVFLATSDEAILIMMSHPQAIGKIWPLLLTKFIIGVVFGYIVNLIFAKKDRIRTVEDMCRDEHCGCDEGGSIWKPVIIHTAKVLFWIFVVCLALNLIMGFFGADVLSRILGGGLFFQPLITALVGLIPNCAVSVLMTELYINGTISFASAVAGLSAGAGVGLIVLFKMIPKKGDCFKIIAILYFCASVSGLALQALNII